MRDKAARGGVATHGLCQVRRTRSISGAGPEKGEGTDADLKAIPDLLVHRMTTRRRRAGWEDSGSGAGSVEDAAVALRSCTRRPGSTGRFCERVLATGPEVLTASGGGHGALTPNGSAINAGRCPSAGRGVTTVVASFSAPVTVRGGGFIGQGTGFNVYEAPGAGSTSDGKSFT